VRGYRLVVVKSTVVPGTTREVVEPLLRRASGRDSRQLGVASNPEFLSEGSMVKDALHPGRVVLGVSDARSARTLRAAYRGFNAPILELTPPGAELVKHASNAFLALKVSYANELSRWAELFGENVDDVAAAVGADPRIGTMFLRAGPGFGGSCFEKDLRAMVRRGEELEIPSRSATAALAINDDQTEHAFDLVRTASGSLRGKTVALLGLAFKAGTDDVRQSRALPLAQKLLAAGVRLRLHDPSARRNFEREWTRHHGNGRGRLRFSDTVSGALRGADLAVLQAEWPEYLRWPARWSRRMRTPLLVDLRRAIPPEVCRRAGLRVVALGVGERLPEGPRPPRLAQRRGRR
jgi:UDPglucose 6-dehydrogenase